MKTLAFPVYTPGRVTLAGQPQPDDWTTIKEQGYDLVVNLRPEVTRSNLEAANAAAAGLRYLHLPLPAYELTPPDLREFAELIAREPGRIFFHCRSATRVALIWLLYRTEIQGATPEQAEAELREAGYDDDSIETLIYCADDYRERATTEAV